MGIYLLEALPILHNFRVPLLCVSLALSLYSVAISKSLKGIAWLCLFLAIVTCFGASYFSFRIQSKTHYFSDNLSVSREVFGELRIIKRLPNSKKFNRLQCIAQFSDNSNRLRFTENERIFVSTPITPEVEKIWLQDSRLEIEGLHTYFSPESLDKPFYKSLSRKGVYSKITHLKIQNTKLEHQKRGLIVPDINHMRIRLDKILSLGASEGSLAPKIYKAMLLGQKENLISEQKNLFIHTGTMHLFAVSGLHIGVIALFISQSLGLLRAPSILIPVISIAALYYYVQIIEAPPSALRALLMITLYWVSLMIRRQSNGFSALVLSALILLAVNPWQIFSIGFQLSYTVVANIILWGIPFNAWMQSTFKLYKSLPEDDWSLRQKYTSKAWCYFLSIFSISVAAWVGSLPLCIQLFGYSSTGGLLANILIIQIASLVILTGVLSLGFGIIQLFAISEFLNYAAWLQIHLIDTILRITQKLPFPTLESDPTKDFPGLLVLILYFGSLMIMHLYPKLLKSLYLLLPPSLCFGTILLILAYQ